MADTHAGQSSSKSGEPPEPAPSNKSKDGNLSNRIPDLEEEEKGGPSSAPVGFWDSRLRATRLGVLWRWCLTTVTLMVAILAVLSLYWAVFFDLPQSLDNLEVFVVNMDGAAPYHNTGHKPIVGDTVVSVCEEANRQSDSLRFTQIPASNFDNNPVKVRQAIYDFGAWASIVINPNATALLYSAIENGNKSYDPLGACQLTYVDSRDDTNFYDFILPILNQVLTETQSKFGEKWGLIALENITDPGALSNIRSVPQAVNPAIGFSVFNLRPFFPYTNVPAVTIGLIYLIIISFFSFSFYMPIHALYLKSEDHPPLKFWQLIIWRWCATITAYLFLSLAYSLISLAFLINFSGGNPVSSETQATSIAAGNPDGYGNGTFLVYWMINYWGMIALGLACENVAMLIGMPWTGLWLIFWVITNVSTSFYDIEIEPGFYKWGYAWPLHHVVQASRQILFGQYSQIGLNFGVLVAWGAVNTALFPFFCYFLRWKTKRNIKEYWA